MSDLSVRYQEVEAEVARACASAGRRREEVVLLAVSKFQPLEAILEVAQAGQRDFGENYLQEAKEKMERLAGHDLRWHMIGHLQTRKARSAAGAFELIHSLDNEALADGLQKRIQDGAQDVLIEVNIGSEPQKSGVMAAEVDKLAAYVLENCPSLRLRGLMCMPPIFDNGEASRPFFEKLRLIREQLEKRFGLKLPELSMGMSGDFQAAIAEGATIVRIGTAIFGPRPARRRGI